MKSLDKLPDWADAIYISYKAESVEDMASWLNKMHKSFRWRDEPHLTPDLCRCIMKVWKEK